MERVYIGIGSNLGDRELHCTQAIEDIASFSDVTAVSSYYETEPVGNVDQPHFINCVVEIVTDAKPHQLLEILHSIEKKFGRVKLEQRRALQSDAEADKISERRQAHSEMPEYERWGPRTIDLDIIFYGDEILNDPDLKIPHPEAHKRRFVLEPLAEIAPGVIHPITKATVANLLENIEDPHKVVKLEHSSTTDQQ